jgi:peptide/nickel transport system substrate-binding protein
MSHAPSPAASGQRRLLARLLVFLFFLGVAGWVVLDLAAQPAGKKPPVKEEEEEAPKTKKDRIKVEEEEDKNGPKRRIEDPDAPAKPADGGETLSLRDAYQQSAGNPALHDFFNSVLEPHDRITFKTKREVRVQPVEDWLGDFPPSFKGEYPFKPFGEGGWTPDKKSLGVERGFLRSISYYEQIAQEQVDHFLAEQGQLKSDPRSRLQALAAAQTVLDAALAFHDSARARDKRKGKEFEELGNSLRKKRLDVAVEKLQVLARAGEWNDAFKSATRLVEGSRPEDRERVVQPLIQLLTDALKAGAKGEQLAELQRRLAEVERLLPNSAAARPIQEKLKKEAEDHFKRAQGKLAGGNPGAEQRREILDELRQAEAIWPALPGLRDTRLKLENAYPVLRVGVRNLPQFMSPGMACTDAETLAVELIFESLVKLSGAPGTGEHYTPGLSEGRPQVLPVGRQFQLARGAAWGDDRPITVMDVRATVNLLKDPRKKWRGYLPAWDDLYENVQAGGDPTRVNVILKQGFVDPLALMTFKVLPAQPWPDQPDHHLTPADEPSFAQKPVGSGPYQYQGPGGNKERPSVVFVANPLYAARPAKYREGLPQIREIQFVLSQDPVADLRNGVVNLVVDLPSTRVKEVQDLRDVAVLPAQRTRRIHFLAVNHRRAALQNDNLRKAIAHAIPRDSLLDGFFRGGLGPQVHRPLTGPYPPGSWACDPALVFAQAKAKPFANQVPGLNAVSLTLKCPADEPQVGPAMEALVAAVKNEIGIEIKVERLPPRALREAVEETHSYDLAYYYYDFPSDAYWLWPLFDPNGLDPRMGNYLGYTDGQLAGYLGQMNLRRDIRELQKLAQFAHRRMFEKMPLIPLWQLDRHVAMGGGVKYVPFDPLSVFGDVDRWRLEKK